MLILFKLLLLLAAEPSTSPTQEVISTNNVSKVIVVVGAAGEEEYGKVFSESADLWKKAAEGARIAYTEIGRGVGNTNDLQELEGILKNEAKQSLEPLWLVFLGHGTFDGKQAKFNMRGPDLVSTNLASMLQPFERPLAVFQCASASAPFLNHLSKTNRVIITSTRSGSEQNYARFGYYVSKAIGDLSADLDKDGQVSALEAFLFASRQVEEFYKTEGRLATEHALIDDNGDQLGTGANFFRGIRVVKKPVAPNNARADAKQNHISVDGLRAHQLHLIESDFERKLPVEVKAKRNALELEIEALREKKSTVEADAYYAQLEERLLVLSKLYESLGLNPQEEEKPGPTGE